MEYHITLPSKPRIVSEEDMQGIYEIDSLYPGYGHTLGNSLRRIILSSLPGATVTRVKIEGVPHEFATIDGARETVMEILLNLKRIHFVLHGDEPQTISLLVKGTGEVTAKDFKLPSQVEIMNPGQHICDLSGKASLELEAIIERGLGYVSREVLTRDKVDIGTIALDATFTPIRRVNYEVENMRVGDRTNYNRLRLNIETDGTITPHEALEKSIEIMITQLKAVVGFKEPEAVLDEAMAKEATTGSSKTEANPDILKTRIEDMGLSARTLKALSAEGIRTIGGLARKREEDLLEIEGLGGKSIEEIKDLLASKSMSLKA